MREILERKLHEKFYFRIEMVMLRMPFKKNYYVEDLYVRDDDMAT